MNIVQSDLNSTLRAEAPAVSVDNELYWAGLLGRKVRPLDDLEAKLFVWGLMSELNNTPVDSEKVGHPVCQAVLLRFKAANLEASDQLALLVGALSKSFGDIAMYTYTLALVAAVKAPGAKLTLDMFATHAFPWGVPTEEAKHAAWDEQKVSSVVESSVTDNLVDDFRLWPIPNPPEDHVAAWRSTLVGFGLSRPLADD